MVEVERMKHPYTGLYYYCLNLATYLEKFHGEEFDFTFFKYPGTNLPAHLKTKTRNFVDKTYLYKDHAYDLWHGTWQLTKYVPKGKIKFVYTIHDLNFLYTDKAELKKKRLLQQIQERIDRADVITTISQYVKSDIEKHLNTRGKPVEVIYNGVELKEFPDFNSPKFRPEKPFLFALGTVLYKKHFHVLPSLLPGTDFDLVVGGIHPDKNYIKQIREEAKKYGVEDRVHLIGPVSDEEKYWYLTRMEAFLFPSISEGFGLPPIEAMLAGKPVFLSTLTSLPEIGGPVAYYFENFEPAHMREVLQKGLEDYQKNKRAEEIKKWAGRFSWENAVQGYTDVYKQALGLNIDQNKKNRKRKVTAIIPTLNEEQNIEGALASVKWADEIIVLDSLSGDRTIELARKHGAKILSRKFDDFSSQKNYAIEQAENDWIFVLDADERISLPLQKEILDTLNLVNDTIAYWIPRVNYIGKKRIRFSGWQNDKCIRLFNRKFAKYDGSLVHEEIAPQGKTGKLKNKLIHFTYRDFDHFKQKAELYSTLKAKEWLKKGRKYSLFSQCVDACYRFIKHYIIGLGFLDGITGFKLAVNYMKSVWKRHEKLKKFQQENESH